MGLRSPFSRLGAMAHRARNWDVWREVSHRVHMLIAEGVMFGFSREQTMTVLCTGCLLGRGPGQMPVGGEVAGLGRQKANSGTGPVV